MALSCDFLTVHSHTHFLIVISVQAFMQILICIIASLSISLPPVSLASIKWSHSLFDLFSVPHSFLMFQPHSLDGQSVWCERRGIKFNATQSWVWHQRWPIFPGDPSLLPHLYTWVSEWVKSLSRVWLFATPWTVAHQAPPSMGFSRQEYWSGLPFPSPGDLPDPGIEPRSPALQADALTSEPPGKPHLYTY